MKKKPATKIARLEAGLLRLERRVRRLEAKRDEVPIDRVDEVHGELIEAPKLEEIEGVVCKRIGFK